MIYSTSVKYSFIKNQWKLHTSTRTSFSSIYSSPLFHLDPSVSVHCAIGAGNWLRSVRIVIDHINNDVWQMGNSFNNRLHSSLPLAECSSLCLQLSQLRSPSSSLWCHLLQHFVALKSSLILDMFECAINWGLDSWVNIVRRMRGSRFTDSCWTLQ